MLRANTTQLLCLFSAVSIICGLNFSLSLASDAVFLFAIPISSLYFGITMVHLVQRRLLGITWKLLRGRHASRLIKLKQKRRRQQKQHEVQPSTEEPKGNVECEEHMLLGPNREKKVNSVMHFGCS